MLVSSENQKLFGFISSTVTSVGAATEAAKKLKKEEGSSDVLVFFKSMFLEETGEQRGKGNLSDLIQAGSLDHNQYLIFSSLDHKIQGCYWS